MKQNLKYTLLLFFTVMVRLSAFSATAPTFCRISHTTAVPSTFVATSSKVVKNNPSIKSCSKMILSGSINDDDDETLSVIASSDQLVLGIGGTLAAFVTFYSEFTLKTTGCGLPAGPFGLVGLVEGLSYLSVAGIAVYSIVTKVKTVRKHHV